MGIPTLNGEDVAVFSALTALRDLRLSDAKIGKAGDTVRIAIGTLRTTADCVGER